MNEFKIRNFLIFFTIFTSVHPKIKVKGRLKNEILQVVSIDRNIVQTKKKVCEELQVTSANNKLLTIYQID